MVRAYDGPLQEAPDVLCGVDMDFAPYVFLFRMVDRFVLRVLVCDPEVRGQLVGIDGLRLPGDVLADEALQGLAVASPDHLKADSPATLHSPDHDNLIIRVSA